VINKTLIITGATGGMGQACAKMGSQFASQVILFDLDQEKLNQLKATLKGYENIITQTLDITNPNDLQAAETLIAKTGCDGVIHTIGISPHMAKWEKIVEVDLIGAVQFMNLCKPHLSKNSCFLAISSMSAYLCQPHEEINRLLANAEQKDLIDQLKTIENNPLEHTGMAYSYAKKGLQDYIKSHAKQWGNDQHKRIVTISPGFIATDQGNMETAKLTDFNERLKATAFNEMGRPEDIANAAYFLISDKANYITGIDLLVDAGFVNTITQKNNH